MIKVYDFNKRNLPCGVVGKPREIAWPCEVFRVTLPKHSSDVTKEFNAFELCVLKLLAYGRYDVPGLARETCLPEDLIEVILLRLRDHGMVDENNKLQLEANKLLEKQTVSAERECAEYATCAIFREMIGGTLLPVIKEATLPAQETDERGAIKVGDDKYIGLHHFHCKLAKVEVPSVQQVLLSLRTMNRRKYLSGEEFGMPSPEFIAIADKSEICQLRARVVCLRSGEWRIVNPFGNGWSPELESAYTEFLARNAEEDKSFREWQGSLVRKEDLGTKNASTPERRKSFDTADNRSSYPELIGALKREDVYASLEWALFYAIQSVDAKSVFQLMQVESRLQLKSDFMAAVEAMGGVLSHEDCIPIPSPEQLKSFGYDGNARMQIVLPIAILASRDNPQLRMDRVFAIYPDFISYIMELKGRRDLKRHGRKTGRIYGREDHEKMCEIVSVLLPSIRFDETKLEEQEPFEDKFDLRMLSIVGLQEIFGSAAFNNMDRMLQENLIMAEMFCHEHFPSCKEGNGTEDEAVDATPCINMLYAACQCAFRSHLETNLVSKFSIEAVNEKAMAAGLGELPMSLRTVKSYNLEKTLSGNDQTLNACAVVWVFASDETLLRRVAVKQPSFLQDVDELIGLRGHANQICHLERARLERLRSSVYNIIKNLTEE